MWVIAHTVSAIVLNRMGCGQTGHYTQKGKAYIIEWQ